MKAVMDIVWKCKKLNNINKDRKEVAAVSSLCKKKPYNFREKPSPTQCRFIAGLRLARDLIPPSHIKRIPLLDLLGSKGGGADSRKVGTGLLGASMTVEAAVVLPLLLFFFLNLMSAVEMLRLHGNVALSLWENGRVMAVGGYVYDRISGDRAAGEETLIAGTGDMLLELGITALSDYGLWTAMVRDMGEDYLEGSPLAYGKNGLNFLESRYMEEDCIDVKVTYRVAPYFDVPGFTSFRMVNRYYVRAWTGYQVYYAEEESTGDIAYVYVTEYGEVYHARVDCSHLKRNVRSVTLSASQSMTNSNGEKYVRCMLCRGESGDVVYLTPSGNRYHDSPECPALVRNIRLIEREAAEARYRPCSRCAA